MEDYLRSNDYIIPKYQKVIDAFVEAGGDKEIPPAILGVKKEYLDAAFDEMQTKYGTIELSLLAQCFQIGEIPLSSGRSLVA